MLVWNLCAQLAHDVWSWSSSDSRGSLPAFWIRWDPYSLDSTSSDQCWLVQFFSWWRASKSIYGQPLERVFGTHWRIWFPYYVVSWHQNWRASVLIWSIELGACSNIRKFIIRYIGICLKASDRYQRLDGKYQLFNFARKD